MEEVAVPIQPLREAAHALFTALADDIDAMDWDAIEAKATALAELATAVTHDRLRAAVSR